MRIGGLGIVLTLLVLGCATRGPGDRPAAGPGDRPSAGPVDRETSIAAAVLELGETGSAHAEEFLKAAGEAAVPYVSRLLDSKDMMVRQRARSLLMMAGAAPEMTSKEHVELILFDLTREDPYGYAGLVALERLRRMGSKAVPALRAASGGGGRRGDVARRLLDLVREEP